MSDVIQDRESIKNLNEFLSKYAVEFFVHIRTQDEDWLQYSDSFPTTLSGNRYDTLLDYINSITNKEFELEWVTTEKEVLLVKNLIMRTSYIKNFGGSLSLSVDDLNIIERIRVFSVKIGGSNDCQ